MPIHQLFPEPVYFSKLERALTKEELKTINKYKKKTYKNAGNITSNETYVLENKALKNLKKELHTKVMDYFDKIVCPDTSITPYITQSWISYTETNQYHHKHTHPNSYISGVFYIDAQKEVDSITFYKTNADETIRLNVTKYNSLNSTSCSFPVETGNIFLFRSFLIHGVKKKKGTNTRISLSFNVFIKGKIGDKSDLTALVLE
jgi:uncharacterized protein (TIGR02466 family)